jgi:hypothetical protein
MVDSTSPAKTFDVDLTGKPRLLLGWRPAAGQVAGARVPLHDDVFQALRQVATTALEQLAKGDRRPYEPNAVIEQGEEHFFIDANDLPKKGSADLPEAADLIQLIEDIDQLDSVEAGRLASGRFLFYAVVMLGSDGPVGFVRKVDPAAELRKGIAVFQFADTLRSIAKPDLILYSETDLIVGPPGIAAFSKTPLQTLLSDVQVALQDVPENVKRISDRLRRAIPLSEGSAAALRKYASSRPSAAARMRLLPERLKAIKLNSAKLRKSLRHHGVDASLLIGSNGNFDFGEVEVPMFLDAVEARWFEDDFSGEKRRADRFSKRQLPPERG